MMCRRHIRGASSGEAAGAGEPRSASRGAHPVPLRAADRALLRRLAAHGRLDAPAGLRSRVLARCAEQWSPDGGVEWFPVVRDLVAAGVVLLAVLLTGEFTGVLPVAGYANGQRTSSGALPFAGGKAPEAVGDPATSARYTLCFPRPGLPSNWIRLRCGLLGSLVEGCDAPDTVSLSGGG